MKKELQTKIIRTLSFISIVILLSAFFYSYLARQLWDYDFWWHIATGRYIVETGHLPDKDPFSYASELSENSNLYPAYEALVLKNYWLAQVIFYEVYKMFGDRGMIILRSSILMLAILAVFWGLKRARVQSYIAFPLLFLVYYTTLSFTGERPVLFTLLFSVIVFLLLDSFRRKKTIFLLIPLMLLWANLHAGVIIGCVIIVSFVIGESIDIALKRAFYTKRELFIFCGVSAVSLLVTVLNPNGLNLLIVPLSPDFRTFTEGVQEYQSVFVLYWNKIRSIDIGYVTLAVLSPIVLVSRAKKMATSHIILLVGFFVASITALRFLVFFVVIGALLLGGEVSQLTEKLIERGVSKRFKELLPVLFAGTILFSSIVYFVGAIESERLQFKEATQFSVPKGAVDFVERERIPGNVFNDFGFGGYFVWRLYPWKKDFVDTRSLNSTEIREWAWISDATESARGRKLPPGKIPLWKRLLDHYKVNFILLDTLGVQGDLHQILFALLEDNAWVPVYSDLISVIFVRNTEGNQAIIHRFRLKKEAVYNAVIVRATQWAILDKNPVYLVSLGDIFAERGMLKEAVTAYEYAMKRLPYHHPARLKMVALKEELDKTKKPGLTQ
jgi:hypothetical protein